MFHFPATIVVLLTTEVPRMSEMSAMTEMTGMTERMTVKVN